MCSLSPPASLWQQLSLPCAVSSMHVLQCHSLCHSSSLLLCVHAVFSPALFQFLRCIHCHIQHRVPGIPPLSSSMLVVALSSTPGLHRGPLDLKIVLIPSGLHTCSILSLDPLTKGRYRNLGVAWYWVSVWRGGGSWLVLESAVNLRSGISIGLEDSQVF